MQDDPERLEKLIHAFLRMHGACMRGAVESRGLDPSANPMILFAVCHAADGGPVTQREIADRLGIAPPSVAASVKRMVRAGLLDKQSDDADLRKARITLTERGRVLAKESMQAMSQAHNMIVAGMTEGETEELCRLFRHMIQNMRGMGVRHPREICSEVKTQ